MALIEQAIFTSARTERFDGYQVAATSPGVVEADARALAAWGPSHDALLDTSPDGVSFNFHPLPSGAHCVSRTTAAGPEYSGRGGLRVYTQCLIVPADVLARFANNPFAVLRAAFAAGVIKTHQNIPARLEPVNLMGRSATVDATLLARLVANPGADWLAALVDAALYHETLGLVGGPPAEHLIAGLINCLPPECRTAFSFSTGLVYSSRRPFRMVALPDDSAGRRRAQHQYHLNVFDLSQAAPPTEAASLDGWARFLHRVLQAGRTSFLAAQFSKRRFALTPADLPALGLELLEEWDAASLPEDDGPGAGEPAPHPPAMTDCLGQCQRAHAAHQRFEGSASAVQEKPQPKGMRLDPHSPETMEKLERLDDLVFGAMGGKRAALEELRRAWPDLRDSLDDDLLSESREQYVRRALLLWENSVEPDGLRVPENAMLAMDVLCVLFG